MRILNVLVVVALSAGLASAQSLGDIARRERERRAGLPQRAPLVTNEDMERNSILSPGRRPAPPSSLTAEQPGGLPSHVATPSTTVPLPAGKQDVPLWQVAEQPGFSLGEYVRRLQQMREARETPQVAAWPVAGETPQSGDPLTAADPSKARTAEPAGQPGGERAASAPGPIRVRRGDSLWKLSSVYFGSGKLWGALWQANPQVRKPELIFPGQSLRWPSETQLADALSRHGVPQRAAATRSESSGLAVAPSQHPVAAGFRPRAAALKIAAFQTQEASFEHSDPGHSQRNTASPRSGIADAAGSLPAGRARTHRDAHRLRNQLVRRLHGPAERPGG